MFSCDTWRDVLKSVAFFYELPTIFARVLPRFHVAIHDYVKADHAFEGNLLYSCFLLDKYGTTFFFEKNSGRLKSF